MNKKVLKTLEYNKIIDALASHTSSPLGRALALALLPVSDPREIEFSQQETEDALNRILRNGNISFQANVTIRDAISRLEKGSTVSAAELLQMALFLDNAARVKAYGSTDDESRDSLSDYFLCLTALTPIRNEIRRCIISEDEISDDASSNLRSIRRQMRSVNDKIHNQLGKMVSDTYRNYLQDSVITMRDGRYCIPVKAEYKSNVVGMIHDQSSSASTYFIEPAAIVSLNNEIRELEIAEAKEIQVILSTLSASLSEHLEELKSNLTILPKLDFIFAKGSLALSQKAIRPTINEDKIIRLKKARHPLLDPNKVVPIDVTLGDDFDLMIITGPNTGGKTVTIKTIGLLTLMGQAGLHIPASDHSEISVFNEVYADIGDEQSIEQSLSTFSSHMKTIVRILSSADRNSLCLFDELGAGTDPTEGAALAIAILQKLHKAHIRTVATTHYSELKIYALRENRVINACCEFDVESLRPTYRLLVGIPGKSNAFAISSKLGLAQDIIDAAKEQLSAKDESFEDVISQLEAGRREMEENQRRIELYKHDIEALKATYEQRKDKLNSSKDKIIEEAKEEARKILKNAKDIADEAIREVNKSGSFNIKNMEHERMKLRNAITDNQSPGIKLGSKAGRQNKASDFTLGQKVRIVSMNLDGTVHTLPDSKGNLFVQCGIMRMQSNISDLMILMDDDYSSPNGKMSGKGKSGSGISKSLSKASSISAELNLIGLKVDEALPKLDKYLDDAYLSHLASVRIVHGKGTGALRSAVTTHLKKISYVKSFRQAEYGEGDAGVTIVEFK